MTTPLKPPSSIEEQIKILKGRNLVIENEDYAKEVLARVNYYRLSAYGLGLHIDNCYKDGTRFETIYCLYEFDIKFRYVLLEAIENIEVMLRTKIAYHMAVKYGSQCHLDASLFYNAEYHNKFIEEFEKEKERQKDTAFVKHHNCKYEGKMPIWVAVELFSFGMLSRFYGNMNAEDQSVIASHFSTSPTYLRSWLKSLVEVRNICAHYGRIYNRMLNSTPKLYGEYKHIKPDRIFAVIVIIKRLLSDPASQRKFVLEIRALIEEYDEAVNLSFIGFPFEWKKLLGEYIETEE